MKTVERLTQFLVIYAAGLGILWVVKIAYRLSDYVIPPFSDLIRTAGENGLFYAAAALDTLAVAIAGHMLAILLATAVGLVGRSRSWVSSLTRTAAYNLQSYPIVAVAPIIFIFLGDGLASRLLIASVICYFPLLLSFIGVFAQPIDEIEHFFISTGRINWRIELAVRTFENLDKLTTVIVGSATMAMVGTIVAEFLAATRGIGYVIRKALYQGDLATILVALFLVGMCSSVYISLIETVGTWVKSRLTGEDVRTNHGDRR